MEQSDWYVRPDLTTFLESPVLLRDVVQQYPIPEVSLRAAIDQKIAIGLDMGATYPLYSKSLLTQVLKRGETAYLPTTRKLLFPHSFEASMSRLLFVERLVITVDILVDLQCELPDRVEQQRSWTVEQPAAQTEREVERTCNAS